MKRIFTLISLLCAFTAFSQQYNNEWIDYNKTYYKFKIGQTGLYRLPKTVLDVAGLGSTPAEQFKLIRNGVEVPIYTTSPLGQLAAGGYIEFWGEANDGKADKQLYRDPTFQHSDKISLQTDTAIFFLTVSTGTNKRLVEQANNTASSVLTTEPFFMHTTGNHFKTRINSGFARNAGEYVYSSSYDQGEYWSSREIKAATPLSDNISNLPVYTAGPQCYLTFGASGNTQNRRKINVNLNNTQLFDREVSIFEDTSTVPIYFPVSLMNGGSTNITFSIKDADAQTPIDVNDRAVVSFYDITYPRKFDFSQAKNFPFSLPAKNEGYLLAITNFNKGAVQPVLYDLTYGHRYTAVYSATGDSVKFALPGTLQSRNLVLVNEEASNVIVVSGLTPRTFINYNDVAKQGDYIIISNPILYNGANGTNPVADYRDYRRSADGGSYNAIIVEIDQLVDQFAFGIKKHPSSIKNFTHYAYDRFNVRPKYIFMIGRGVDYVNYRANESSSIIERLNLIPSFGYPASDNYLASLNALSAIPAIPIGRLSTVHPREVTDYLQKMKDYEHIQKTAPNTIKDRLWMKNVMHVTGASQSELGITLCNFMQGYKSVFDDTLTGTKVRMFCKSSANPVEQLSSEDVADLFEEGLSMVTYFGHSSTTTLEFNIDNPENYNNLGKYPVFSVNGCNAGNFFTYYPQRLEVNETLSEKFVLAKDRGAIAFLASTHYGIVNYLNIYVNALYKHISNKSYGQSLGIVHENSLRQLVNDVATGDFFARCHSEEITLHGDPAIKMNFQDKPDYVLEDPQVKITPAFLSIAENQFELKVKIFNLGKAINDSIILQIKRQYPNGTIESIYKQKIKAILYSDSLTLKVPVIGTRDKGANKIIITIDADNKVVETDESNNTITKEVFIYEDEARPVTPYNYSIIVDPLQKLYASTANPFSGVKEYTVEIDTTEMFNSSLKETKKFNLAGGIIEYDPTLVYKNNTVYYWRVGVAHSNGDIQWNVSSFIFMSSGSSGFNQSHFYQFGKNEYESINYTEPTRLFSYTNKSFDFRVHSAVYPESSQTDNYSLDYGGGVQAGFYAPYASNVRCIRFYVLDEKSLKPWVNVSNGAGGGLYGSYQPTPINATATPGFFQFNISDLNSRKVAMAFLDLVPTGNYIIVTNTPGDETVLPNIWQDDTLTLGKGNSLYHKLKNYGFTGLDQVTSHLPYIFVYKKGQANIIGQQVGQSRAQVLSFVFTGYGLNSSGEMTSDLFGPAKKWHALHIDGKSLEQISNDTVSVQVIGVNTNGNDEVLFSIKPPFNNSVSLESVNPKTYPNLRLKLITTDTATYTPYQINSWKITADFVPEGALAPNQFLVTKDTLDIGEILRFGVAFKNVSAISFDSIKTKVIVIDKDNVSHSLLLPAKSKPLVSGDTISFHYDIDTRSYPGANILNIDFNPDNDQPEQYHYNNFLYRNFYVRPDNINPLLDVTFDGVHILNKDIVSSKPHIQIKVKDEAKFMLLNDTSVIKELKIRFPDMNGTVKTYKFDNDTLRFTPAQDGSNTATIDFSPYFPTILDDGGEPFNPDGDDYELIVMAKDKSGNNAGSNEFKVSFRVIDKPMISNLLNYPNPFTTSTAFVFTLTGSELPQNMKIQILTVTGKIVREITKEELGPIHIGRNITEFKWNGTDQYGQRLGNGVYLYRVVTSLNGKRMDKFKSENDDTDKYFNRGYGKMYLMR